MNARWTGDARIAGSAGARACGHRVCQVEPTTEIREGPAAVGVARVRAVPEPDLESDRVPVRPGGDGKVRRRSSARRRERHHSRAVYIRRQHRALSAVRAERRPVRAHEPVVHFDVGGLERPGVSGRRRVLAEKSAEVERHAQPSRARGRRRVEVRPASRRRVVERGRPHLRRPGPRVGAPVSADEVEARANHLRDAAPVSVVALDGAARLAAEAVHRLELPAAVLETRRLCGRRCRSALGTEARRDDDSGPRCNLDACQRAVDVARRRIGRPLPEADRRARDAVGHGGRAHLAEVLDVDDRAARLVVEDGCRRQRLRKPDRDGEKPREARRLLDLDASLALDVGQERDEAPQGRRVVLGRLHVEGLRRAERP